MAKSKAKIYFGGIEKIKARIKLIASGSVIHGIKYQFRTGGSEQVIAS